MTCLHCGKEIERGQYGAESDESFQARLAAQLCRAKCKRLHGPAKREVSKPTLHLISACYDRGEGRIQEKRIPERDAARLAFARSMPCCICGAIEGIHGHHENEVAHGSVGSRTSDRRVLPLCWECHKLRHDKGREIYGSLDVEAIILRINTAYDIVRHSKKVQLGRPAEKGHPIPCCISS